MLELIVDREVLLTDEIGHQHDDEIACERRPRRAEIADEWDERNVQRDGDDHTEQREVCTELGLVDELVPEREVEVNALEKVRRQDDRHDAQAFPVVRRDEQLEHIDEEVHAEEDEPREYDEELHGVGVCLLAVLVLVLGEDERLVGVAERLGEHHHHHRHLEARSVYSELSHAFLAFAQVREEYLVHSLVHDAGDAEHEQRQRVFEHGLEQREVGLELGFHNRRKEHDKRCGCGYEVGDDYVAHAVVGNVEPVDEAWVRCPYLRADDEEEDVQHDVDEYHQQLENCELDGFFLVTQVGERYGGERVDGYDHAHYRDEFGVAGVGCAHG